MTFPKCAAIIVLLAAEALGQMAVTVAAVQNGASFTSRITPGAFVTIRGTNLAAAALSANIIPVPDVLGGVSITVDGLSCPVYYVDPAQINFLLPWATRIGSVPLIVTANGQTLAPVSITVSANAPGIFQYGPNRAVAQNVNDNFILNTPTAPAAAGSSIAVYVTGIGRVTNTPPDGYASPGSPAISQAISGAVATIGGVNASVTFLGLTPGQVGLAQANITVPPLASGDYPLVLIAGGLESTSALISVKGTGSALPLALTPVGTVIAPTSPLQPALQGAVHSTGNVVVSGNFAYLCDSNGIAIVDVSNPSSPRFLSNFGQYDVNGAGRGCALSKGNLLAFTTGVIVVYDLTMPAAPQRVALTQFPFGSRFLSNSTLYVWAQIYDYNPGSYQIVGQEGEFSIYDLTNPLAPKLDSQLVQNFFQPGSTDTAPQLGLTVFNAQTAIVLGTTATGTDNTGQAVWTTVDVTNPSKPAFIGQTQIPQSSIAVNLAVEGTRALIAGNTLEVQNPLPLDTSGAPVDAFTGNLTLHSVDFSIPASGAILGTLVTSFQATSVPALLSLGGGFFALTFGPPLTDLQGPVTLAIVDARIPASIALYSEYAFDGLQGMSFANGLLYSVSNGALTIYSVTLP